SLPVLYSFPTRRSSDLGLRRNSVLLAPSQICSRSMAGISMCAGGMRHDLRGCHSSLGACGLCPTLPADQFGRTVFAVRARKAARSEEHTSELQSPDHLV